MFTYEHNKQHIKYQNNTIVAPQLIAVTQHIRQIVTITHISITSFKHTP